MAQQQTVMVEYGHVHRFWSYSFGHLHSVKLTTLILIEVQKSIFHSFSMNEKSFERTDHFVN